MITFSTSSQNITRAEKTGKDAADALNNNFVVEGVKWNGSGTPETVFDNYNVNWKENTANTTTSNTHNWEYVGQLKHAFGPDGDQTIKYWDYAKSQYDFIAYSKGKATAVYANDDYVKENNVLYGEITPASLGTSAYTIKGKAAELAKTYIADLVTVYRDKTDENDGQGDYQKPVQIKFRSLSAKVRIALYETVPGYSVKDVKFYNANDDTSPNATAKLYTDGNGSNVFNEEGTYKVYYPTTGKSKQSETDYNKAHLQFTAETSVGTVNNKTFGSLDISNTAEDEEVAEKVEKVYLGRTSNNATYAGEKAANHYTIVLPNEDGAVLNLKVDYTLLSTDGSGETIKVIGATAKVPAVYAQWKSGYAYTYLFKISQNTNGATNPTVGPAGLYPITFDAVVTETEDGVQETITTVAEPSITTYAKGQIVTSKDEYTTGSNIYVVVNKNSTVQTLTVSTNANANLYTVTLEDGAAQTINEASVANALANGTQNPTGTWTVTDANGKKMTVTAATGLTAITEIAAADAPDGNAITVNGAKFTPATAGTYVFEYIGYVQATGTYISGTTYYDNTGATVDTTSFTAETDVSSYYVQKKYYKIIKVASGS